MNKYQPYNTSDIDALLHEPWEVSDQPFKLHAAFALSSLYDLCTPETDEDEEFTPDDMWGIKVPKSIIDRLVIEIATDFNDAASQYKPIRIWGKPYSIRKVNAYDRKRLNLIFNFPSDGDDYIITKEGVLNLAGITPDMLQKYEVTREQAAANRTYLRQIIKLAEDDANDGWDKLTDMEIIVYCWAMYYNKHQMDNFILFKQEYKDYLYVTEADIMGCLNEKATLCQGPTGMYSFSYEKVQAWNTAHRQKSKASEIPKEEADDYWYEVALKNTFKPIDQR